MVETDSSLPPSETSSSTPISSQELRVELTNLVQGQFLSRRNTNQSQIQAQVSRLIAALPKAIDIYATRKPDQQELTYEPDHEKTGEYHLPSTTIDTLMSLKPDDPHIILRGIQADSIRLYQQAIRNIPTSLPPTP